MAIAEMPLQGADPRPDSRPEARPAPGPPTVVPDARAPVPGTHRPVPPPPADVPGPPIESIGETLTALSRGQRITAAVTVVAALILSGIGLYLSFEHVAAFAHERLRFRSLGKARLFTIGVDVGILVLIAVDLLMAWLRRPIGWIRYPVWLLTGATVVLNASSAAPAAGPWRAMDWIAGFAHGVVPLLFIVVVEVGRTSIDRVVRPESTQATAGVPVHRWLLAPLSTLRLWRRMRLWAVPTYAEAVAREQALMVYRVQLERRFESVRKAPPDLRLPLTMAPYGLTIDEALALPRQAQEQEAALAEAREAARLDAQARAEERAADAEIARLRTAGRIEAARHVVGASTEQAAVSARSEVAAAARAAEEEARALESAAAAEARARKAAAERAEAEALEAAAETRRRAAGVDQAAAEAEQRAAGIREREASTALRLSQMEESAREGDLRAAEAAERAAETRLRVAEIERRAVEIEDEARMSQRERTARRVARMALVEHGGDVESIPLESIASLFSVSTTTASEYRKDARTLIEDGYRPEGL